MKLLLTREEIIKALNFGKYPVFTLNFDNANKFSNYAWGSQCRLYTDDTNTNNIVCQLYNKDKDYYLRMVSNSYSMKFSLDEFLRLSYRSNLPFIRKGDIVAVAIHSSKLKFKSVRLMKVDSNINLTDKFVCKLIDVNEEDLKEEEI
jgi:hypothetical protein